MGNNKKKLWLDKGLESLCQQIPFLGHNLFSVRGKLVRRSHVWKLEPFHSSDKKKKIT